MAVLESRGWLTSDGGLRDRSRVQGNRFPIDESVALPECRRHWSRLPPLRAIVRPLQRSGCKIFHCRYLGSSFQVDGDASITRYLGPDNEQRAGVRLGLPPGSCSLAPERCDDRSGAQCQAPP